ncbi:MAG: cysteine desulfurase family protein [Bacteroidetes bacterium]|jgi:cysteine desulfurase|nr:cysteine desulfurase family protein [Bacteroidota bacterium]
MSTGKPIYLDNAATTPIAPEVLDEMIPFMREHFGNPSSTHSYGRKAKDAIETARRKVATLLGCSPAEISFTSGGTEADNLAIHTAIHKLGVKHIVSTRIEHKAVLNCIEYAVKQGWVDVHWLNLSEDGAIDLVELEDLLHSNEKVLVTLMHANNEIANLIDLKTIGDLCKAHNALFHSDTVQSMGHYRFDLDHTNVDFITGAAHKFHGPKGVGFLYHRRELGVLSLIHGGGQERNHRAGTENIYGIIGLAKALDIAYADLDEHEAHIRGLKTQMMSELKSALPEVEFNGQSGSEDSLYTVLNVNFPKTDIASMMLFRLDLEGVACSGGSACSSGAGAGSHVLDAIKTCHDGPSVRFSFSRYTTTSDITSCVDRLAQLMIADV